MPWNDEHKQYSREKILCAAAELFTHKGFQQVGIDEIMQSAGLTRGAFYAHFSSKLELYEEAIFFAARRVMENFNPENQSLEKTIENYLSQAHLNTRGTRCPLSSLVTEVSQTNERMKHVYTRLFKGFSKHLSRANNQENMSDESLLQAVLMIGGLAISRSLTDPALAKRILNLCSQKATGLVINTEEII